MNPATPASNRPAALEVHHPIPLPDAYPPAALPAPLAGVASVQLPDGRIVTGYPLTPAPTVLPPTTAPVPERPAVSRTAVNIALGGVGFAAVCGGLALLTTFIVALTALIEHLIILAAILFGAFVAVQLLRSSHGRGQGGTTVNIGKAVIKRNYFHT